MKQSQNLEAVGRWSVEREEREEWAGALGHSDVAVAGDGRSGHGLQMRIVIPRVKIKLAKRMMTFLIATRNRHKVEEIQAILGAEYQCLTLNDFPGAPEVVEDAGTFAGNATKKAVELARWVGARAIGENSAGLQARKSWRRPAFVLADDSGLEVDALRGEPGVHSARFAALDPGQAGNSSAAENNAKLLRLMDEVPDSQRQARFRCVVALTPVLAPAGTPASPVCLADELELRTEVADGTCEGRILRQPRGEGGFGYDPLFVPEGYEKSFGELSEAVKNRLSHRAKALEKLKERLASLSRHEEA